MDADIVTRMRQEEATLAKRLKAVRDLLAAYDEEPLGEAAAPVRPKVSTGSREKVEITGFTEQTRKSVVLSMQAMLTTPNLMKTRQLVEFVEAMGHEITGDNKVNALGALLARSVDIISHGKSGWSLVDRGKAMALVEEYTPPKENEPTSGEAVGSDAGDTGASTPYSPFGINPLHGLRS